MLYSGDTSSFFTNYFTNSINFSCTLKIGEILNLTIFRVFIFFCNYVVLGGQHVLNISEKIFPKLILHLRFSCQLSEVLLA